MLYSDRKAAGQQPQGQRTELPGNRRAEERTNNSPALLAGVRLFIYSSDYDALIKVIE